MIKKTLKKLITFNDRNIEMMEAISAQSGWKTPTEIVKRGIEELYTKYFPAYKTGSNGGAMSEEAQIKSAKIKVKVKEETEKAEIEAKEAKKVTMCEEVFGGKIVERPDGMKVCVFTSYHSFKGDTEEQIPLSQVDPIVAENSLFLPSIEAVFKHRPDVRKKFSKMKYYADKATNKEEK